MLFKQAFLEGIAAGAITLAFRRWRRPTVKAGGRLRTAVGELAVEAVDVVDPGSIGDGDARRAGYPSRQAVLDALGERGGEGQVYRIALRYVGADPRVALRERGSLDEGELSEIERRLARLDGASRRGRWTEAVLALIEARPGVRAAELAAAHGVDTAVLKADVRKLKELGLTESLDVGYRLSPRGRALRRRRFVQGRGDT
ncbi:hypothetical protein [Sorangium sp. So ce1389]|uniref:hypothetical protein n=1 Tax=Sorangium sp. So ce1389 TaxID=3133336 RepID=UPI003F601FC0